MKIGWRGVLGILLSAGFLYFAFRGIELDEVMTHMRTTNVWLMVLAAALATGTFPLRAIRWRPILDPVVPDIPYGKLWRATAIGMMINNVVPARVGEIARAFALTRSTPALPFPAALASLVVDRLLDAVVLFGLMFAAMLAPAFPQGAEISGRPVSSYAIYGLGFTVVVIAALYAFILFPARVLAIWDALSRRMSPKIAAKGRDALISLSRGLSVLRAPRRFAVVLWWTLAHWLLNAFAFWVGFRAAGMDLPFSAALFLQGIIAVGVAVPQAPGFFGVFEHFARIGLVGIYGVPADAAVSWAIAYHLMSYVPITLIGAWYFLRAGISMGEISGAQRSATGPGVEPGAPASVAPGP
ncbi:MAG TPA: lysylphosphatidylglycerol synthase transmembrane domain-containing protein [Gemmatimonadaceae bacterium]|nr:lysylphosphatidylglycerol synthase transmembrane domain-containing protein [Gemmatimonadaceae bacterium]